jgi:hypothetical protein
MEAVKKVVLERAVRMLDSLKLDYAICLPDGEDIIKGKITLQKKGKRVKGEYAHGTFSKMFRELGIDKMSVGDVTAIDCKEYPQAKLRSALAAFCVNTWGPRSAITTVANDKIEVMRIDG